MDFNKKLKQIFKQKLYRFILYSLLIHFVIWQKIAQQCKAIIHQLKKKRTKYPFRDYLDFGN